MPTPSHGVDVDEDCNRHASMMNASHSPSSVNLPQNARISLVRNSSTGRPVWWIDHGISSLRAEVMLRRKLIYLQEQHDKSAALDNTTTVIPAVNNSNGVTIRSKGKIMKKDPSSQLDCLVDRMTESKLSAAAAFQHNRLHTSIRHLPNENGTEKYQKFIDTSSFVALVNNNNHTTEAMSSTKPQSPNDGCDDATDYPQDTMMNSELIDGNNGLAHEISLDDQHSILMVPKIATPSKIDQALPTSHHDHHHRHVHHCFPTVQLSHATYQPRITYLDFDEGNIVGKMAQQYFCIVAPIEEEYNGCGQEFHIRLKQSLPERGIMCLHNNTTDDDVQDSSCDENKNVVAFRMKQGESKTMKMIWNPIIDGCMRERIDLMVTNHVGIHWKQSIVLVGEAHSDAVDKDEGKEEIIEVVESNDWMVDKHTMVSDVTDTVYYSHGDIALENSGTFHYGEKVSLRDELHDHNHSHNRVHKGIKEEDDSMAYSQETNELLPMTDNEATAERMTLWNVNLSAINEISDYSTREALTTKAHEMSLESGGSVLGHLTKIDETDKFMDIITIRSYEPSNCTSQVDTTAMFHSLGVFPEEPHDIGRQGYTSGEASRTQSIEDGWTNPHHISKLEETKIDFSTEAFKLEQDTGYRMENWDKEQLLTVENEERTRIKVDQEHYRLQSKEINDFEYLLVTEGLVEGGMTLAGIDASDCQIELDIDLNSDLINFAEAMRPKSPSFGSLTSKDSIDGNSSLPSSQFDERPRQASLLSASLAETQGNLDPIDDEVEYLELQSQSGKLVRTQSSHSDVEDEPTMAFSQMLEQTSDSDNSYEAELGNTMSELNAVIDKISEIEVDLQMQHEYITSPSNLDVYTQLVNLNDHADGTTPLSINRISDPTEFFRSNDKPSRETSSRVKIEPAAQSNDFAKQSNSYALERSESKECDFDAEHRSEHSTPSEHFTKVLPIATDAKFKTPYNSRLEKIASIRDKLSLITIDDTLSNGSSPYGADRTNHPTVSTVVTRRGALMVNDLPNSTKTSARKCYFYTSPARHDARTNSSPTETDSQSKRLPDEIIGKECDKKDNESITTVSLSHLRPREIKAREKHIRSIREQNNKDNSSPIPRRGRNGSFPLPPIAPSPRELKAYEKHIRSMRERLNRVGMTYSCPGVITSPGKNDSPVTGVYSPTERGRWSG